MSLRRIECARVALYLAALTVTLTVATSAAAGETPSPDFDQVAASVFWQSLYGSGGWTLYCGFHFDTGRRSDDGRAIGPEHIYPTAWMLKALDCRSRMQCRAGKSERFKRMEADMHNIYPVWQTLIALRNGRTFGVLPGEDWRFDDCDIEWQNGVIEPRPLARGNVARAMFYMQRTYDLPLDRKLREILVRWNREDPVSKQEQERNDAIAGIQGRRNPFIDKPELADTIK